MVHLIGSAIAVDTTSVVVRVWIPQRFIGTMLKARIPTIAQIAERLGISCSTVKRRMKGFPLRSTSITPRSVALQMDTTYSRSKL